MISRAVQERLAQAVANVAVDTANLNLLASDAVARFDVDDIVECWRRLGR